MLKTNHIVKNSIRLSELMNEPATQVVDYLEHSSCAAIGRVMDLCI